MTKDRPTGGFRFKKRVPIIKLPFGLGDVKVNFSMSHGIESVTAQGKLGKLQSNISKPRPARSSSESERDDVPEMYQPSERDPHSLSQRRRCRA